MSQNLETPPLKSAIVAVAPIKPEEAKPKREKNVSIRSPSHNLASQIANNRPGIVSVFTNFLHISGRKILRFPYPIKLTENLAYFFQDSHTLSSPDLYKAVIQHWHTETKILLANFAPLYPTKKFAESLSFSENQPPPTGLLLQLEETFLLTKKRNPNSRGKINKRHYSLLIALSSLHLLSGNILRATEFAEKLFRYYRKDPHACLLYACILMQDPALYDKPLQVLLHIENIKKIQPELRLIALEQICLLQIRMQRLEDALESMRKMIEFALEQNILPEEQCIQFLIAKGNFTTKMMATDATFYICKQLKPFVKKTKKPGHIIAYHHLFALAKFHAKNWNKALFHLSIAKKLSKSEQAYAEYTKILFLMIHIAKKAGKHKVALQAIKELRAYALAQKKTSLALAFGILAADVYEECQQWRASLTMLMQVLQEAQSVPYPFAIVQILNKIAHVHICLGEYAQAQQRLHHASDIGFALQKEKPDLYRMSCMLTAMLAVRTGNISSAEYWFEKANCYADKADPLLAASFVNLGYLKFQSGEKAKAVRSWERARSIYRRQKNGRKIKNMNQHIERLYAQKPRIDDVFSEQTRPALEEHNQPPGPTITRLGKIKRSLKKHPSYPASDFELL